MTDTQQILPHLPPILRDFCAQTQESLNLDPLAPILPMLSVASAAIGNSRPLSPTPDLLIRPVIWSALLSPESPRYAHLLRLILNPLTLHQAHIADNFERDLADNQAQRLAFNELPPKLRQSRPHIVELRHPMLYLSDPNPRLIARNLHANPRGLLLFLENLHPALPNLRDEFFTASPLSFDQPKSLPPTLFIRNPFLSITGLFPLSTAPLLDCSTVLTFLLYFPAPPGPHIPLPALPLPIRQSWHDHVHNLLDIPMPGFGHDPQPLSLAPESKKIYTSAHNRLRRLADSQSNPVLRDHLHNLISLAPRLALIFHLLESPKPAQETTVPTHQLENAITVLEFFLHHTIHLHATLPQLAQNEDPDFDHHLHIIRSLGGVITPRQLVHSSRFFRSSTAIAVNFLNALEKAGLGQITWPHRNGHPSMLFKLFDPVNGNETPRSTPKNRVSPKPKPHSHKRK